MTCIAPQRCAYPGGACRPLPATVRRRRLMFLSLPSAVQHRHLAPLHMQLHLSTTTVVPVDLTRVFCTRRIIRSVAAAALISTIEAG